MTKISPGERAVNWAKALAVLCTALVTLLGYTNRDAIGKWTGLTEADGKTEVISLEDIKKFSEEMREEIERIDAEEAEGRAMAAKQATTNYRALVKKQDSQSKKINKITELVN